MSKSTQIIRSRKQIEEDARGSKSSKPSPIIQDNSIINFYEREGVKKHMPKKHNPNKHRHGLDLYFNGVIIGASGSGKTQCLLNLMRQMSNTFHHCYIFTQNNDEALYSYLAETVPSFQLTIIYDGYRGFVKHLQSEIPFFGQSLVVFDDMATEKDQTQIEKHFIMGRKRSNIKNMGCCSIYLSQSYSKVPLVVRLQCSLLIIIKLDNIKSLKAMLRDGGMIDDIDKLKAMYTYSTQSFGDFLLIDKKQNSLNKIFRKSFNEYLNPNDF